MDDHLPTSGGSAGGTTTAPPRLTGQAVRTLLAAADAAGAAWVGPDGTPCQCRPHGDRIEVWAGERAGAGRPDRPAVIGCGAAVLNLRLGLAHLGFEPRVTLCPPGPMLATVAPGPARPPSPATEALYAASTAPGDGADTPVGRSGRIDRDLRHRLHRAARAEGATLHEVHTAEQRGLLGGALRRAGLAGPPAPDRQSVFLLATAADGPDDWVRAGQALQRILLTGRLAGVRVARPDQPVAVQALRGLLPRMPDVPSAAQLLVLVGGQRPTPG